MMWNVTLSTMWAVGRFDGLAEFFATARTLGLTRFELNHQVDSQMLSGVDLDGWTIASIHEPCPADIPTRELNERDWLISSADEENRQRGLDAVRRSIDLARELGAGLVVVHAGRVAVDARLERAQWDLWEAGQAATSEYAVLKERLVEARAIQAPANLDAACRSVAELAAYAAGSGVRLGIENRYHYLDVPMLDEMEVLLAAVGEARGGFLYDVGHAQTLENLGFAAHEAWLERYAARMVAVHLHDIRGLIDHAAAGLGEVDWDMVARHLPRQAMRTLEFHASNSPDEVRAALDFLAEKGCIELARRGNPAT